MDYQIELYRGSQREYFGTIPFMSIIRTSLESVVRRSLDTSQIFVTILQVPEEATIPPGLPLVEHLIPEFGYTYIQLVAGASVIYQHPHTVMDVITLTLQKYLRETYPDETSWGFRLSIPGMPALSSVRQAPVVAGAMEIDPSETKPGFAIRRLPETLPEPKTLADFGISAPESEQSSPVKVVISPAVNRDLMLRLAFSDKVEEGGFLVGQAYPDATYPDTYIIHITETPAAQHTGAPLLHFTFTGDSFAEVKQSLRQSNDKKRLVGWYHTHLFAATPEFGLSSIDLRLHFTTFTFRWQVAGLVNLNNPRNPTDRTLRFYITQNQDMVQCPHWIAAYES